MGMKSLKGPRWTLQLYWPTLWRGKGRFGIQMPSCVIFTHYADGSRAGGFEIFGFGFGLMREVAIGVTPVDGGQR